MFRGISIPIEDKVFSVDDIMELARILYAAFSASRSNNKTVTYFLALWDGQSYELVDQNPTQLRQIITSKKVTKINFDFFDFSKENRVAIKIAEGDSWGNKIDIDTKGDAAFNKLRGQIEDWLESVKPQNNLYLKYRSLLAPIVRIYFGVLTIELVYLVVGHIGIKPIEHPTHLELDLRNFLSTYRIPVFLALAYLEGLPWQWRLFDYLDKLWPPVEFDFGPEHLRQSKSQRKYAGYITTAIVIPVLFQFLFFVHL